MRASSQPKPTSASKPSAGQNGAGGICRKLSRRRQINHRLIGRMM